MASPAPAVVPNPAQQESLPQQANNQNENTVSLTQKVASAALIAIAIAAVIALCVFCPVVPAILFTATVVLLTSAILLSIFRPSVFIVDDASPVIYRSYVPIYPTPIIVARPTYHRPVYAGFSGSHVIPGAGAVYTGRGRNIPPFRRA